MDEPKQWRQSLKWSNVSQRLKQNLVVVIRLAVILGVAVTVLGFLGKLWWMLDLLAHFRVQYCWVLVFASLGAVAVRRWRWLLAGGLGIATNLSVMLPLWIAPEAHDQAREQLDVLMFNVHHQNRQLNSVVEFLRQSDAELIVIVEATPEMERALGHALPDYEIVGETRTDAFGMLVCSRLPIEAHEILYLGDQLPALAVSVRDGAEHFSVLGIHTMPPIGSDNSAMRDQVLEQAGEWAAGVDNAVVIGDFNASPWSHAFSELEATGLVNSQRGFGMQLSWPSAFWPLSIAIDHCLHAPSLTTISRRMGPFLGSDHKSLRVSLGFRK